MTQLAKLTALLQFLQNIPQGICTSSCSRSMSTVWFFVFCGACCCQV